MACPAVLVSPTAYARHLVLVLEAARRHAAHLFTSAELALCDRLPELAAGDALARLVQRREPVCRSDEFAVDPAGIRAACAAGWLQEETAPAAPADDGQTRIDLGAATPRRLRLAPAATVLVTAALAVATAGEQEDLSFLVRLALGQPAPPSGSPLDRILAGGWPELAPAPWLARPELDAFLAARAQRAAGGPGLGDRALVEVEALAGQAFPLAGHRLTAAHQWTRALWEALPAWRGLDPRRTRALAALRRAPCSPGLARRLWAELHRQAGHGRRARALAAHLATWRIFSEGERRRWRLRATGRRIAEGDGVWPVRSCEAWLERDEAGAVLAEGLRVEAWALARLAEEGWQGLHAEGGFWLGLAETAFAPVLAAPLPVAWTAPLQQRPADLGAPAFALRRRSQLSAAAHRLRCEPATVLASCGPAAMAVAARLPAPVLVELLLILLERPSAAAGLPDLVCWRDDAGLALVEVKSPGDRLSDAQRHWLRWCCARGIDACVLRLVARTVRQDELFPSRPPVAPATPAPVPRRWQERRSLDPHGGGLALALGGELRPEPGDPLPGLLAGRWSRTPWLEAASWAGGLGMGQVQGWDRGVEAICALPVRALAAERRDGSRLVERRWFPLPEGWALPLLLSQEAQDDGLHPCARILIRASGWLLPRRFGPSEAVVAPAAEIAAVAQGRVRATWARHPALAPLRPEEDAAAWGLADQLAIMLDAVGDEPCLLESLPAERALRLALPRQVNLLWFADPERIRRAELEERLG